jgi:hypothetical protein
VRRAQLDTESMPALADAILNADSMPLDGVVPRHLRRVLLGAAHWARLALGSWRVVHGGLAASACAAAFVFAATPPRAVARDDYAHPTESPSILSPLLPLSPLASPLAPVGLHSQGMLASFATDEPNLCAGAKPLPQSVAIRVSTEPLACAGPPRAVCE